MVGKEFLDALHQNKRITRGAYERLMHISDTLQSVNMDRLADQVSDIATMIFDSSNHVMDEFDNGLRQEYTENTERVARMFDAALRIVDNE